MSWYPSRAAISSVGRLVLRLNGRRAAPQALIPTGARLVGYEYLAARARRAEKAGLN